MSVRRVERPKWLLENEELGDERRKKDVIRKEEGRGAVVRVDRSASWPLSRYDLLALSPTGEYETSGGKRRSESTGKKVEGR